MQKIIQIYFHDLFPQHRPVKKLNIYQINIFLLPNQFSIALFKFLYSLKKTLYYIFLLFVNKLVRMSIADIIIDPIVLLQMTQYFEKNISQMLGGASFGFLYAKQVQLKFLISLTAPLGTDKQSVQDLATRGEEFQAIRRIKSKTTQSYFLSFQLVGVYIIRRKAEKQDKKLQQLSNYFANKGFPYSMIVIVDQSISFKFYKNNAQFHYIMEMQPNEKICVDSYNNQNSKSPIGSLLRKQNLMIHIYNDKVNQIIEKVQKNLLSETELIELTQILDNYDRIKYWNSENKLKALQAMNYSLLVGLSINKTMSN